MIRNVYLQGELGEKFGTKFRVDADTHQEIIKCINANRSEFKPFLLDCHEKDVGFTIEYQNELVQDEDLLTPLKEGDVTIALVPAGSKKAFGKILAAVFLAFVVLPYVIGAGAFVGPGATFGELMAAGFATATGKVVAMVAINLAMAGISQAMAPDPSVDNDSPENYAFSGSAQNIAEGDPVPIIYGELRIPGRPVSSLVTQDRRHKFTGNIMDGHGNLVSLQNGINEGSTSDQTRSDQGFDQER